MIEIRFIVLFAVCFSLCCLWVSGQSFWIDECCSALKAVQPNFNDYWAKTLQIGGSDVQMPLYMLLLWIWEKVAGSGEFALRSLNLFFAAGALICIGCGLRLSWRQRVLIALLFAVSPAFVAYLDEARPYALQIFSAVLVFVSMFNLHRADPTESASGDVRLFCIGILTLCGSSLTGVVFAFWFCLWFVILFCRQKRLVFVLRQNMGIVSCVLALLLLLGAYYSWTLFAGFSASKMGRPSIQSILFCGYELCGFMGLGPGRSELRMSHASALSKSWLPIAIYAVVLLCVFLKIGSAVFRRKSVSDLCQYSLYFRNAGLATVCGIVSLLVVGLVTDTRILGRHLLPALPILLFLLSMSLGSFWNKSIFGKWFVILFFMLNLYSSSQIRFSPRHAKDDYKGVVQYLASLRQQESDQSVWWFASTDGLEYYYPKSARSRILPLNNPKDSDLESLPVPDIVVLSKPDLFDRNGTARRYINRYGFVSMFSAMSMECFGRVP